MKRRYSTDDNENGTFQQLVTARFLTDVEEVLKEMDKTECTATQFTEAWLLFDSVHHPDMDKRREAALEYFNNFTNSRNDPTINLERMRKLLPYAAGYFSEAYIKRAQHVNVPWLLKAVKKYHQKIGSSTIKNAEAPQQTARENANILDFNEIELLEYSVRELEEKHRGILEIGKGIKTEAEEQSRLLKKIPPKGQIQSE